MDQKKARDADADLVFTDESGLLMGPLIRTTLAPIAQAPILRTRAKHRQKVSVAAALFRSARTGKARLVHETFVDQYVDDFLYASFLEERVVRGARHPLVLLQDGAPLHHGYCTQDLIDERFPKLTVHEFPPYAPELNPTEQLWKWAKYEELANFLPESLDQLTIATEHVITVAEHDQQRLQTFLDASALPW